MRRLLSRAAWLVALVLMNPVSARAEEALRPSYGGVGVWGEGFAGGKRTGVLSAGNVGGGVLVPLAGPLRLRLDYRLFLLGEVSKEEVGAIAPRTKHPQRIAAGIHFAF